jgi:8-oxo-dGTP diphosphatase
MNDSTEPKAAVAIVCARGESILLIRRSQREDDPWSGHWSLPGGRRDSGDIDLLHTALRELEEECGVRLEREHSENALPHSLARRGNGPFILVAPFVFGVEQKPAITLDENEAVEALWISKERLLDPGHHRLRAVPRRPSNILFPAVDLEPVPLWGFTYRLLTEWLGLLPAETAEQAGFEAASRVLDALLAHGMKLKHRWEDVKAAGGEFQEAGGYAARALPALGGRLHGDPRDVERVVKRAVVEGPIPVESLLACLSRPGSRVPAVNWLVIQPDFIRVTGLDFEDYLISAL